MSIWPEIVVAPLLVYMWILGDASNRQFQWLQRVFLGRTNPESYPRKIVWGWRLAVVALGVLWVIGLVRRFA